MNIIKIDENLLEGKVLMVVGTTAWRNVRTLNFDIWQRDMLTSMMQKVDPNVTTAQIEAALAAKKLAAALGEIVGDGVATKIARELAEEKARTKLSQPIIECDTYSNIVKFITACKKQIERVGVPFPLIKKAGLVLASENCVEQVDLMVRGFNDVLLTDSEMVLKLQQDWEMEKQRARDYWLKTQADYMQRFYPKVESLPNLFKINVQFVDIKPSSNLPKELQAKEYEQFQKRVAAQAEEVVVSLRTTAKSIVDNMINALSAREKNGKKPRIFETTLLGNLQEFIDTFGNKNLFNDDELQATVDRAREIVAPLNVEMLKESESLRIQTAARMKEIQEKVTTLVDDAAKTRRFRSLDSLDEEDN